MAAAKIKKGDSVVVLSGKDKGKTGTVAKVMPKDGKVVVEGVPSDSEQLSRTDVGVAAWRKFAVENARRPPAADEGPSPEAGDGGRLRTAAE